MLVFGSQEKEIKEKRNKTTITTEKDTLSI